MKKYKLKFNTKRAKTNFVNVLPSIAGFPDSRNVFRTEGFAVDNSEDRSKSVVVFANNKKAVDKIVEKATVSAIKEYGFHFGSRENDDYSVKRVDDLDYDDR